MVFGTQGQKYAANFVYDLYAANVYLTDRDNPTVSWGSGQGWWRRRSCHPRRTARSCRGSWTDVERRLISACAGVFAPLTAGMGLAGFTRF